MDRPLKLILWGLGLLVMGVILPFMMILQLLESTMFLNFVAAGSSIGGLITGFIGISLYVRSRR
ncbi:MAG: hypothetical protein ACLFVD_00925 [Dehalococcoidia bacterium]